MNAMQGTHSHTRTSAGFATSRGQLQKTAGTSEGEVLIRDAGLLELGIITIGRRNRFCGIVYTGMVWLALYIILVYREIVSNPCLYWPVLSN